LFKVKLLDVTIHKLSDGKGGFVKEFGGLVDRPVLRSDEVLQVDD